MSSVFPNFWCSLCSLDSCNLVRILLELENKSLPLNYKAIEKVRLIKNVGKPTATLSADRDQAQNKIIV